MSHPANTVEDVFAEAIRLPDPEQRAAYLTGACGVDAALRRRVEALLKAHDEAGSFMAPPSDATAVPTLDADAGVGAIPVARPRGSTAASHLAEKPGAVIGRYKLLQQIGEGGFGVVYMADQEQPVKRRVALKIIKAGMDTRQVIARFEAERQALAMMDHPNIAHVLDAGATDAGRPYFVMELVKGIPITQYCDEANLATRQRLELFKNVCSAVQHAHHKGIIHRDLKPSNILITLRDGLPVVKVIDFGIAKATEQKLTEKTLFTQFGQMIGTPTYMSPEQAAISELDVDTRSDVYSLGVLLYELLAGGPPFDAKTLHSAGFDEMRRIIREQEPLKPSTKLNTLAADVRVSIASRRHVSPQALSKQLHGDLDWIVMKAIEKDRARRYESASALALDIERHLHSEPVTATAPTALYRLRKFAQRNKGPVAAAAAIAALLVAGTVVSTRQAIRATNAEQRAVQDAGRAIAAEKKATDALDQAIAERDAKERARREAEQIASFLTELFRSPDPSVDGREIKVLELLDKASRKLATDLTAQPAERARLQGTLANTYHALGLARLAVPLDEQIRDYHVAHSGPEHADTIRAMGNLAVSYRDAGRRDDALKLQEQLLALLRKRHGPEHPDLLTVMNNLALSYRDAGRRDDALKVQEQVLPLRRKVLGPEHPETLRSMTNLAISYREAGRWEETLKLQEQVLPLLRQAVGPEHPDTIRAMNNLAISYFNAGRQNDGLTLAEQVLPLLRKVLGPENRDTLGAMTNLAIAYGNAGRLAEALAVQGEAIASMRRVLPANDPFLSNAINHMVSLYEKTGRAKEAAKWRAELAALRDEQ